MGIPLPEELFGIKARFKQKSVMKDLEVLQSELTNGSRSLALFLALPRHSQVRAELEYVALCRAQFAKLAQVDDTPKLIEAKDVSISRLGMIALALKRDGFGGFWRYGDFLCVSENGLISISDSSPRYASVFRYPGPLASVPLYNEAEKLIRRGEFAASSKRDLDRVRVSADTHCK